MVIGELYHDAYARLTTWHALVSQLWRINSTVMKRKQDGGTLIAADLVHCKHYAYL